MSTTDTTAGQIFDSSAALLNDAQKSIFTNDAQLPYLKIACDELQELCELYNIPVSNKTSAVIAIPAGANKVVSVDNPNPSLVKYPSDLIDIQMISERQTGTGDPFQPMQRFEFVPHWWETSPATPDLEAWVWIDQEIQFNDQGATADNDIKLDYIKTLFPQAITENSVIGIINSKTFLSYRTAALCALYIGENESRAQGLDGQAVMALDRLLGIGIKGKQAINTRRRPFMSNYRSRIRDW